MPKSESENDVAEMFSKLHPSAESAIKKALIGTVVLVLNRHNTLMEEIESLEAIDSLDDFNSWG